MAHDIHTQTNHTECSTTLESPVTPKLPQELFETILTNLHFFCKFTHEDWSVLTKLPESEYWNPKPNNTIRDILVDEYEIANLDQLYDDANPVEWPDWFRSMKEGGDVYCLPIEMTELIQKLFVKLDKLSDDENIALIRIIALTHLCQTEFDRKGSRNAELLKIVDILDYLGVTLRLKYLRRQCTKPLGAQPT